MSLPSFSTAAPMSVNVWRCLPRCNLAPVCPYIWTVQRTKSPGCFLLLLFLIIYLCIYFWLHWVLVAWTFSSCSERGLARTWVSCIDRPTLNHWTPREVPHSCFKIEETETHGGQMTFAQSHTQMPGRPGCPLFWQNSQNLDVLICFSFNKEPALLI